LNDLPLNLENEGPVSVTLVAESYKPVKHISKITLFKNNDRIELENFIHQNIGAGPVTYSFSFDIESPEIWHEEAGLYYTQNLLQKEGIMLIVFAVSIGWQLITLLIYQEMEEE
jgi:alpha-mannosidase